MKILALDYFNGKRAAAVDLIVARAEGAVGADVFVVFTPNPEQIVLAQNDAEFAKILPQADLLLPDGNGIVMASKLLGHPLTERIAGVDVVAEILQRVDPTKILVLGGRDYAGQKFHWIEGYADVAKPTAAEEAAVKAEITKRKPEILFVAFGAPFQEKWISAHREFLHHNQVHVAMVVGGAFDFLTGKTSRAPEWMQHTGLEWLHRLIQEPWRWRRQLRLVDFCVLVIGEWWKKKF